MDGCDLDCGDCGGDCCDCGDCGDCCGPGDCSCGDCLGGCLIGACCADMCSSGDKKDRPNPCIVILLTLIVVAIAAAFILGNQKEEPKAEAPEKAKAAEVEKTPEKDAKEESKWHKAKVILHELTK